MLPYHAKDRYSSSRLTKIKDKICGWVKLISSDAKSRSIFLFLVVNLTFAFVELIWGIWSNSLSLISDSFHMFFDCTGLLCGLLASMITKWKPNDKFTYGYVRAETLAGFVNGLFLLFVAFFIFSEAVERIFEPPEVHHDRLMVVSILGLGVNILGIFVFHGHVHGHSHGSGSSHHGHSHGHDYISKKNSANGYLLQADSPFTSNIAQEVKDNDYHEDSHSNGHHNHSHHGHSHNHGESLTSSDSQIMKGVFLHVLADTLGSVGVIVSAILMKFFGCMIADPICSLIIACLISVSVLPLIKESAFILMMRSPSSLDDVLPSCYQRVMCIEGVYSVQELHFWTLCSDVYIGTVKLEVAPNSDPKYVTSAAHYIFSQAGVRQTYIQLDFAPV